MAFLYFFICYCSQFGEKQNIRLVRFLNSTVMVRVGGGWVTLDEFLETNDPCRGMLIKRYEQFTPLIANIAFIFLCVLLPPHEVVRTEKEITNFLG